MKRPENVEKNLVDNQKAQKHPDRVGGPVEIEVSRIVVAHIRRENQAKGQNLRDDVGKEAFELAVQPAAEQNGSDSPLDERMSDPQSVIENRSLVAHKR